MIETQVSTGIITTYYNHKYKSKKQSISTH